MAHWAFEPAAKREDAEFELGDLRDFPLPHLDEGMPPSFGQYTGEHTRRWAEKVASFDGFVVITPEYNHSTSGVLKNALDYLFAEWPALPHPARGAHAAPTDLPVGCWSKGGARAFDCAFEGC